MQTYGYLRHPSPDSGMQLGIDDQQDAIRLRATTLWLRVNRWPVDEYQVQFTPMAERPSGGWMCRNLQPGDQVFVAHPSVLIASSRDRERTVSDWHERGVALHIRFEDGEWFDTSETCGETSYAEVILWACGMIHQRRSEAVRKGIETRKRKRQGA